MMNQKQIGRYIAEKRRIKNLTQAQLAEQLGISDKTVRNHISNVMLKLGVKGRAQAVVELLRLEELDLEQDD